MADNVLLNLGSGGDTLRTIDRSSIETPVSVIDVGGTSAELLIGDAGAYMPIEGAAAENAAVAGKPILIGARYDATPRTLGDGDVGAIALAVDGAVQIAPLPANDGVDIGDVDVTSMTLGGNAAAVIGLAGTNGLGVAIVDTSGNHLSTFVNSELNQGTVVGANFGILAMVMRDDALSTLTDAESEAQVLRVDSEGALWTTISGAVTVAAHDVTNAGTFAVQAAQAGTWNVGTVTTVTTVATVTNLAQMGGAAISMGTGVRDAGSQRVTIATDDIVPVSQSGTWNVTNVSGTVSLPTGAATAANQTSVIGTDGAAGPASVVSVGGTEAGGNIQELRVDADGHLQVDILSGGGGGTQYTLGTDTYTEATSIGTLAGAVRVDSAASLVNTDNEITALQVDSSGSLRVTGGGGGTEYTEDVAAPADPVGTALQLRRTDTPVTVTGTDGDWVAQRATNYGAAYTQIVDSSGNFIDTFGGAGGTSHTDDAAFSIGSASSVTPVGYLADETAPDSVDEGDVGLARMTLSRKPYAVITDPTSENNAAVDGSGHLQVDIAASSAPVTVDLTTNNDVQGAVAHDAAVSGNPFLQAAEARTAEGTAVVQGDAVRLMADLVGKLVTQPFAPTDLHWQATGNKTDATDLELAAAAGVGIKNYITDLVLANASATNTTAILKDGATEIARFPVPGNGGVVHKFGTPLQTTANAALNIASAASVTTMYFTASGYEGR